MGWTGTCRCVRPAVADGAKVRIDDGKALVPLQRASELSPGDAQPHNNLGNAFMKLDRLHEAEASYRQALKLNPSFVEAYSNLGDSLHDQGRLSEAETSYWRALEIFAEHSEAFMKKHSRISSKAAN